MALHIKLRLGKLPALAKEGNLASSSTLWAKPCCILYDHCYVRNYLSQFPIGTPISLKPLKVLSIRSLPY
jgi:hypothetical protein